MIKWYNYIFNNPVQAGICNKAEEYEFSNYRNMKDNYEEEEYDIIDVEEDKILPKFPVPFVNL